MAAAVARPTWTTTAASRNGSLLRRSERDARCVTSSSSPIWLALFGFGFRRPFLFVLAYVYVDIVSPQRLTYLLLNSVPISLIAVDACGGRLGDRRQEGRAAGRAAPAADPGADRLLLGDHARRRFPGRGARTNGIGSGRASPSRSSCRSRCAPSCGSRRCCCSSCCRSARSSSSAGSRRWRRAAATASST